MNQTYQPLIYTDVFTQSFNRNAQPLRYSSKWCEGILRTFRGMDVSKTPDGAVVLNSGDLEITIRRKNKE